MTRQNRVMPDGRILAHPARGTLMGNRGCLHDAEGRLGPARWRSRAWVTCLLAFRGRRRAVMTPGRYTELFFLDEAVALAAGHRPCGECRRAEYARFRSAWQAAHGPGTRAEMDAALHASRTGPRLSARPADLPDGAFVTEARPLLVWQGQALPFSPEGYGAAVALPDGPLTVLTPPATLAALRAGYRPTPHQGAVSCCRASG